MLVVNMIGDHLRGFMVFCCSAVLGRTRSGVLLLIFTYQDLNGAFHEAAFVRWYTEHGARPMHTKALALMVLEREQGTIPGFGSVDHAASCQTPLRLIFVLETTSW